MLQLSVVDLHAEPSDLLSWAERGKHVSPSNECSTGSSTILDVFLLNMPMKNVLRHLMKTNKSSVLRAEFPEQKLHLRVHTRH